MRNKGLEARNNEPKDYTKEFYCVYLPGMTCGSCLYSLAYKNTSLRRKAGRGYQWHQVMHRNKNDQRSHREIAVEIVRMWLEGHLPLETQPGKAVRVICGIHEAVEMSRITAV
jgi:hypothetical protein